MAFRAAVMLGYAPVPPFGQMTVKSAAAADPVASRTRTASVVAKLEKLLQKATRVVIVVSSKKGNG
jgi:hypothetical protein